MPSFLLFPACQKFGDGILEFHLRVAPGLFAGAEIRDVVEFVGPDPEDGAG